MKPFRFEKDDVVRHIVREMKAVKEFKGSFEYVFDKLKTLGHYIAGDNIIIPSQYEYGDKIWMERKNYPWLAIESKGVRMMIRAYQQHYTIYYNINEKLSVEIEDGKNYDYTEGKYGVFTFFTDSDLIDLDELREELGIPDAKYPQDHLNELPAYDLNKWINQLVDLAIERFGSMWLVGDNDNKLPKRIKIKDVFDIKGFMSDAHINKIDDFVFACEEIGQVHLELFAENEMVERLKELKVGDSFGNNKIAEIKLDTSNGTYYHGAGIKTDKGKWSDVYSLTHWYYDNLFSE